MSLSNNKVYMTPILMVSQATFCVDDSQKKGVDLVMGGGGGITGYSPSSNLILAQMLVFLQLK